MTKETMNTDQKIKTDVLGKTVESLVCTPYGFNVAKKTINFKSLSGIIQEKYLFQLFFSSGEHNPRPIKKSSGTNIYYYSQTLRLHLITQDRHIYEIELSAIQTAEYFEYKERLANDNLSIDSVVTSITPCQNSKFHTNYTSIKFEYLNDCDPVDITETYISLESRAVFPTPYVRNPLECRICGSHSGLFSINKRNEYYTEYRCGTCNTITWMRWVPFGETPGNIPKCKHCSNENGSAYVVYSGNKLDHFCSICHEDLDHSRNAQRPQAYLLNKHLLGKNLVYVEY